MGALRVPVFVEDWQLECCGTPPGVGDRVEWVLVFHADPPGGVPAGVDGVTLDAVASPYAVSGDGVFRIEPADFPTRLDAGGLRALWPAPRAADGPVRVSGRLTEEHHGGVPEGFPPTVGTVRRVRVVTREYVPSPTEERTWLVGEAPPRYRDVPRSPTWFSRDLAADGPYWADSGVLVDLVVSEPDPG